MTNVGRLELIQKGREFIYNISLIQKRVKTIFACRFGKVEVMINYWDKMINKLQAKASELRDYDIKYIID